MRPGVNYFFYWGVEPSIWTLMFESLLFSNLEIKGDQLKVKLTHLTFPKTNNLG